MIQKFIFSGFILWVFPMLFLGSCVEKKAILIDTKDWVSHVGEKYSLSYPKNWEISTDMMFGAELFLLSPSEGEGDLFVENLNVLIMESNGQSLDEFTKTSLDGLKVIMPGAKILNLKKQKGPNGEYQVMEYEHDQESYRLRFVQNYMVVGEKVYVVTFTMQSGKEEKWLSLGYAMLESFRLKL